MTVTLTSPCMGKEVGETYTGPYEAWLITEGYAQAGGNLNYAGSYTPGADNDNQTDYTGTIGPDGLNTLADGGEAISVLPADDPTRAENREEPRWPAQDTTWSIANDGENLTKQKFPHADDFDPGGVDNDAPSNLSLSPAEGPAEGGTVVTISGDNLEGVTAVSFGGTAGTALDVSKAAKGTVKVTTPAGTAGAVDVVLTDPSGNATIDDGFTYTA
jgi:hypothetical protein